MRVGPRANVPGEKGAVIMTTSSREALATGNVRALVESLGADESWSGPAEGPFAGAYMARVGRTGIKVNGDGDIQIHTHDTEEDAVACFRGSLAQLETIVAAGRQGPAAMLAAIRAALMGEEEDTVPVAPAPLPAIGRASVPATYEMSATPPSTGFYL